MIKQSFNKFFIEEPSPLAIKKVDFLEEGLYPIIGQGKNKVEGFTNNPEYLYAGKLPCIIFGEHTKEVKLLNSQFAIAGSGVRILTTHNNDYIDYGYFFLKQLRFPNLGYSRYYKYLKEQEVPFPNEESFNYIKILKVLDNLISKRQKSTELLDEYLKSKFLETFGDPISNPLKFKRQKLGSLSSWHSGGTPSKTDKSYYENASINWFTSGELNSVFISQSKEKVNIKAIEKSKTKNVRKGSLLIGMYDTAALKSSIVTVDCCCNQAIAFSSIDPNKWNTIFIYYNIVLSRDYILNQRKGARQKNLNLSQIKNIDIIAPSIKNQNIFADQFCIIEEQKQRAIQSATLIKELSQSLQYSLFNKTENKKDDEVDLFISDEFRVENLLESLENDKEKSIQQYELEKDLLFKILELTEQRNKENKDFLKGLVLKLDKDKIAIKTNKNDKFGS